MSFRVNESALEQAADTLTDAAGDVPAASSYLSAHVALPGGLKDSGIFVTAIGVLDDVRAALADELDRLRELSRSSAAELDRTAASYRSTDDSIDVRLDSLVGRAPSAGVRPV